ncbi:MAG: hypothetical protein RL115_106 [Bacteroidota bacterium]|jgi:hypothetical protein
MCSVIGGKKGCSTNLQNKRGSSTEGFMAAHEYWPLVLLLMVTILLVTALRKIELLQLVSAGLKN